MNIIFHNYFAAESCMRSRIMSDHDDVEVLPLELDALARRRLARLVRLTGMPAAKLASELLSDLLADDALYNESNIAPGRVLN